MKTMLTTVDNPYSPFDEYEAWFAWDIASGYQTSIFLARILQDSDQLSNSNLDFAIESAIDEIISENVSGVYRKVTRE